MYHTKSWFQITPSVGYTGDDVDCEGGTGDTWRALQFVLSSYGASTAFQIRFLYGFHNGYGRSSCGEVNGWYIDNIKIGYTPGC